MPRGREPKVDVKAMLADVDNYIETANPPIVAEFAHKHGITRSYLYHLADKLDEEKGCKDLKHAIKRISEAKEIMLEKKCLEGEYNSSMSIFSLKQLGWKDQQQIEEDRHITVTFAPEMDEYGN